MRYISTRSAAEPAMFCDILLAGLAPDGGLYLPEHYPQLTRDDLVHLRTLLESEGYAAVGAEVLRLFIDDVPFDDLQRLCAAAWNGEVFATKQVVPVELLHLGDGEPNVWLAHLSDGPTAAFKDLAMQLLGQLFEYELTRRDAHLTILGATSGDTGSAAEHAMLGREHVEVFMLTPAGRMTPFQQAQMFSLDDPSIHNIAVDGVFDDCQDLVKAVFADADFRVRHSIGAVNSINWARLVAQVVYYVVTWLRVTTTDDERIDVCVPSGNFGNICAAHIAREMGLPLDRLVLATNENAVLAEFFTTGVYRVRAAAETHATSSPSMDISKASNFERFVFDLVGRDASRLRELFVDELGRDGVFDLSKTPEFASILERFGFVAASSTHADRVATIADVHARAGVLVDPHTADGLHVGRRFQRPEVPMVVMETALPVKFAETITEAIGIVPELPDRFAGLLDVPRHVDELPNDVDAVKGYIERLAVSG